MRTEWQDEAGPRRVAAPVSLIVSAFAPVGDVGRGLTPALDRDCGASVLVLCDLSGRRSRLGGSCLAQSFGSFGGEPPDIEPEPLRLFFRAQRALRERGLVRAYHDRSDGGLFATLAEMAFASRAGLDLRLPDTVTDPVAYLFAEEVGVVLQVASADIAAMQAVFEAENFADYDVVAEVAEHADIVVRQADRELYRRSRLELHGMWSELTFRMQSLRDNPDCAREAYQATLDATDPGMNVELSFEVPKFEKATRQRSDRRPKIAILREQGVNGQREMAAAFDRAGFDCYDVHMSDLHSGRQSLAAFRGLAACGGFSYGDVLGAGEGWAKSILYNDRLREMFADFFARDDSFAFGVCNGCQMLASLKELIPGAASWPRFLRNRSDQFEARLSLVHIEPSRSILLRNMAGSRLPVVTSHGEGRAEFATPQMRAACERSNAVLRYVTNQGDPTDVYPANPNGSPGGITGLCNDTGRVTIMMPHPERVFRTVQHSWHPRDWGECSPWQQLFDNARSWTDAH